MPGLLNLETKPFSRQVNIIISEQKVDGNCVYTIQESQPHAQNDYST